MTSPEPAGGRETAGRTHLRKPRTVLAMDHETKTALLDGPILARLGATARLDPVLVTDFCAADPARLRDAEVLLTGWGCPPLDERALELLPSLRAVVHTAGTVKGMMTEAAWRRGLSVTSAAEANARPVAEFTVAAIVFANKRVLTTARAYREARSQLNPLALYPGIGNYRRTIGIVGASRIGRRVIALLRSYDAHVLVHDPYLEPGEAKALGVEPVGLDELMARADVVSVHAPQTPETRHLLDAGRLALMRDGATLVNTARGSLVDTDALTAELLSGRLHAVLDVTHPDVLPAGSPLYDLPNVLLTPHIAGSLGNELGRLATCAAEELERYARGLPFAHAVHPASLAHSA
ncbi:hydroxyacid dehydrogenase [Streptomyces sp. 4.24]|uniref:hydroxyacid dehydrogenase n=1 Tax=Streptomyces tritrimontium TaxID=3406573 RepID=UPI003BB6CB12